jgi:hypothetical protein
MEDPRDPGTREPTSPQPAEPPPPRPEPSESRPLNSLPDEPPLPASEPSGSPPTPTGGAPSEPPPPRHEATSERLWTSADAPVGQTTRITSEQLQSETPNETNPPPTRPSILTPAPVRSDQTPPLAPRPATGREPRSGWLTIVAAVLAIAGLFVFLTAMNSGNATSMVIGAIAFVVGLLLLFAPSGSARPQA